MYTGKNIASKITYNIDKNILKSMEVCSIWNRWLDNPRSNESPIKMKLTLHRVEDRPVPITNNGLKTIIRKMIRIWWGLLHYLQKNAMRQKDYKLKKVEDQLVPLTNNGLKITTIKTMDQMTRCLLCCENTKYRKARQNNSQVGWGLPQYETDGFIILGSWGPASSNNK